MATGLSVDDAMLAVYNEFSIPEISPDEFTELQYSEKTGLTRNTAARQLQAAVKAGKLTRRRVLAGGRRCWGYRLSVR